MKKILIIGGAVLVVIVVIAGLYGIGYARAQSRGQTIGQAQGCANAEGCPNQNQNNDERGNTDQGGFAGMMGNRLNGGMMGQGRGGADGIFNMMNGGIRKYLLPPLAQAFGMSEEDLQARFNAGDTPWVIAKEQGLTVQQFSDMMVEASKTALAQMVTDGILTQAQADAMLKQVTQMAAYGRGARGPNFNGRGSWILGMPGTGGGVMRDYMVNAFAQATGMTTDQVNQNLLKGQTFGQMALALGKTADEVHTLMDQVRQQAINQMVADGVITQTEADWLANRMQSMWPDGTSGPQAGESPMGNP